MGLPWRAGLVKLHYLQCNWYDANSNDENLTLAWAIVEGQIYRLGHDFNHIVSQQFLNELGWHWLTFRKRLLATQDILYGDSIYLLMCF